MEHVGVDLAKNKSQVCILTEDGELIERRIPTSRAQFTKLFGKRSRCKILVEASNESEWVARHFEMLGHEVIVADPNFAPMYADRTRRIKTDRRDALELAQACQRGHYRLAHRTSDAHRNVRAGIAVRESLVRSRVRYVNLIQSIIRREGLRMAPGSTRNFLQRLESMDVPAELLLQIQPLVAMLVPLNEAIDDADRSLAQQAQEGSLTARLCTVPGVGPVTATTFIATLDDIQRFSQASQVASYLGLVPSERSSGDKQHRGRITKAGNSRLRCLLVEAAWCILRYKKPETRALWEWAGRITKRRGRQIAAVALARKLARILFAIWRDEKDYLPTPLPTDERALVNA